MENYNAAAARSFNGIRQLSTIPEFHNAPHTYRNGDINHTTEAYTQSSTGDDVLWNSSWSQFLALMKAPSAVSENGTANKTVNSANTHFIPSSFSQDEINLISSVMNTQTALSENGIPNKSVDAVNKHDIPNPHSRYGRNSMQSNIANPSLSNQKQYLASDQQCHDILPRILHVKMMQYGNYYADGFPVPLQLQYNCNSPAVTEADTASSITNSSPCAPETPKQTKKLENNHYSATMEVNGKSLAVSVENEGTKHHCHELIRNIVDASSATICTAVEAKNDSDKGVNQDFDLDRTPPQKTPKRKKHRPKVVVAENKPQRNRKPMNPKNNDPNVEILIKRKYVRKNVPKTTNTPEADAAKKTNNSSSEPTSRSCRKALNFNMENQTVDETWCKLIDQQETRHTTRGNSFINANSTEKWPDAKCCSAAVGSGRQTVRWNEVEMSNKIAGLAYGPCQAIDQAQTDDIFVSNGHTLKIESMLNYPQTEESCVIPCNKRGRATDQCQNANYCSILANSHTHGKVGQSFFQERPNEDKPEQIVHRTTQKQLQKVYDSTEGRGSKREYCMTAEHGHPNALHLMNCLPASQEFLQINQHKSYESGRDQSYSGIPKKKKVKNVHHTTMLIHSMQNCPMFAENVSRLVHTNNGNQILTNQVGKGNGGSFNPSTKTSENPNSGLSYKADEQHAHSTFAHIRKQNMSSEGCLEPEEMEKGVHVSNPSHMIGSVTSRVATDMLPRATSNNTTTRKDGRGTETLYRTSHSSLSIKQRNEEPTVPKTASQKTDSHEKQRNLVSINEIVWQFQYLNLNATGGEMVRHEQNALVRYKDGMIIPYEAFDPTKMRKPRPKVDLDPETNRIWKLLMGKEVSDDDKEMDKDKAKWWEEERKVFRGRADSFIARMRLVQGDRRFSQWKGSVVDSVIGVFLTQNVTDHLSSSAFMSLAARFPIQPCKSTTRQNDIPTTLIGEPEVYMLDTDINNRCLEKSTNPTIYIRAPEKSSNHTTYNPPLANRTPSTVEANNWGMEEVISSQDSTESSIVQAARQSNSRAYCAPNGCKSINNYSSTSFTLQKMETVTRFTDLPCQLPGIPSVNGLSRNRYVHLDSTENNKYKQVGSGNNLNSSTSVSYPFDLNRPHIQVPIVHSNYSQFPITTDSGLLEVQSSKTFGKERITFLPSSYLGVGNAQYVGVASGRIGQFTQSKTALQQNGGTWAQGTPTILYSLHNKQQTDQNNSTQAGVQAAHYQHSYRNYKHGGTMTFQLESRSHTEPVSSQICVMQSIQSVNDIGRPKYNFMNISVAGKQEPTVNRTAQPDSTEQLRFSSEAHIRTNTNTLDKKVEKIAGEKKMTFDWDSLRKQVQSNGRKERTRDTKDSIDYEAIRCADVNEISKAIKDRGMNNMLADRIKDFLNRLVRDHGSIDLEWLRDVPPDKAKDYLLSIRGLGLKSVECVRLLALRQHAFPVDTNVGRIAVRLGWVPLQPLPESLQLHLLELYPVLESIQKYLWPRLCKLDQQTLYELHYQLITFGKVFCTKSKPNCNACPMRGECRHFASAFASSRIALPGLEESSIVTSADAISANRKATINIHPIKLRPLEDRTSRESEFECRRSEPIVEEPTTPVQESTETSETDIEDAFCNDPDEIPIIKLTAENITITSQNCSRGNVELQEWDMSKALVALNPGIAAIPTTKLKNVNRLRTEHQVYELPESHPLLKKLDKREPDDPSPYLLAIWTPGETANSIQPPEGICRLWESEKLCSEKTCFSCNSKRESNSQIVRGTLLIPCRTAMRGSFPLNGTYFQVNEVFADHDSSLNPIDVPRECLWNLPRRTVFFGTSVSTIFKGMSTRDIQQCFWRGFVCVRGFDRKTRAPRPLMARLHFPASKLVKGKTDNTS